MSLLSDLYHASILKAPQLVLLRLHTADHSGASPTEIAESTGLTKTAVSWTLEQLLQMGWIERHTQLRDLRSSVSYLTDEGRAEAERIQNAMIAFVDDVKKREGRVHP